MWSGIKAMIITILALIAIFGLSMLGYAIFHMDWDVMLKRRLRRKGLDEFVSFELPNSDTPVGTIIVQSRYVGDGWRIVIANLGRNRKAKNGSVFNSPFMAWHEIMKRAKAMAEKADGKRKKKQNKAFYIIIFALVAITLALAVTPRELQNDTFYTIKIGEYIADNGISDLTQDPFSYHDLSYTYPHWLYDVGVYCIYNTDGMYGLYIFSFITVITLFFAEYFFCVFKTKKKVLSLVAASIVIVYLGIKQNVSVRAYMLTYLLFLAELYLIESYLQTGKRYKLILLVCIPCLLANLHAAVFYMYYVLLLPYVAQSLMASWMAKHNKSAPSGIVVQANPRMKYVCLAALISLLGGFLNPTGTTAFTYLPKTSAGDTTKYILEHMSPDISVEYGFLIVICFVAIAMYLYKTNIKLSDLLLICGLGYMSLGSHRHMVLMVVLCMPAIATLAAQLHTPGMQKNSFVQDIKKIIVVSLPILLIISGTYAYTNNKKTRLC